MTETEFLADVLKGDQAAIRFIEAVSRVSQVIDDLYDQDAEVGRDDVSLLLINTMHTLQRDPFYQQNFMELQPVIEQSMIDWLTANQFEAGDSDHLKTLAFVLRDNVYALVITCAKILGGIMYAIEVAPKVREFVHDETLSEYLEGLK